MVKLRVSNQEMLTALLRVPHATFQRAILKHWRVDGEGYVDGRSVTWLYCWAKTGMNSTAAAREARHAFDAILDVPFANFDARVDHEWARIARKSTKPVDDELKVMLATIR